MSRPTWPASHGAAGGRHDPDPPLPRRPLYRAIDRAGNTSKQRSLWLRVDRTGPTVEVEGITDGTSYVDSGTLTPNWTVSNSTSGAAGTNNFALLDGNQIRRDKTIKVADLPLGEHTLMITAKYQAGNVTTKTVKFTTTTSLTDLHTLVNGYPATRTISATQGRPTQRQPQPGRGRPERRRQGHRGDRTEHLPQPRQHPQRPQATGTTGPRRASPDHLNPYLTRETA
ncbi:hypothetical protein AB0M79_35975 [Polymorphospora sp. NPDC051019]|uniref:hypothetical protein n=1 Tax=Polymorphospora sp. NPDC051019 TaxID=3155725 RepID=UPI00344A4CCA